MKNSPFINKICFFFSTVLSLLLKNVFPRCKDKQYSADLPRVSIIVPFHDEWPSILYRTIYSVLNRTPRHLLEEIILIDDGSTLGNYYPLEN